MASVPKIGSPTEPTFRCSTRLSAETTTRSREVKLILRDYKTMKIYYRKL